MPPAPTNTESKLSPILRAEELLEKKQAPNFVLIDARTGADIKERYTREHLAGALLVDLETELADIRTNAADGGRHPLPTTTQFASVLNQLGIARHSDVVVYDDKNGANAAARFWWMLRAFGHTNVQVLNGGMNAAIKAGFPVRSGIEPQITTSTYAVGEWTLPLADLEEVERAIQDESALVIDVRDAVRYRGEIEPIDRIAGHIPGAHNIPFTTNLDADGFFLAPAVLQSKYQSALGARDASEVIVHCGSGVTACHSLLAMDYAGLKIARLYVGSWSEWSNRNMPIALGPSER